MPGSEEVQTLIERARMLRTVARDQPAEPVESLSVRINALEIELLALQATARRSVPGIQEILGVRVPELEQQLSELILDTLAYYALADEVVGEGQNEPPIGPDYARTLRACLFPRTGESARDYRTELAKKLLGLDP